MLLPLTVSCFSKLQTGFTFLVPAHPGSPGKRAIKRVCVCVCLTNHREAASLWLVIPKQDVRNHQWRVVCCNVEYLNFGMHNLCQSNVKVIFQWPSCDYPYSGGVGLPSVLWRCWLGGRKGIRLVKHLSSGVLAWLSVWSEVQTCIWPSWCHCHSLSLASVKSRLVLPFWYRLTRVVLEKGPLNGCVCV